MADEAYYDLACSYFSNHIFHSLSSMVPLALLLVLVHTSLTPTSRSLYLLCLPSEILFFQLLTGFFHSKSPLKCQLLQEAFPDYLE